MAKKLSILKPQKLRDFFFDSFSSYNFEDTVTILQLKIVLSVLLCFSLLALPVFSMVEALIVK